MAGGKQPIELVKLKGRKHLTKSEIAEREATEVKAPSDNIRAPNYLSKNLKKEFKKISKELINLNLMSNLDCDSLARFLIAQDRYISINTLLNERNPIKKIKQKKKDEAGEEYIEEVEIIDNNYERLSLLEERYFKQSRQAAKDLGLTIDSRCKLVVPKAPEDKKENKFSRFAK